MAMSDDLINFDLIEEHKENIQALPSGRSAKQLASILSPQPSAGRNTVSLDDAKTLNDAMRKGYEIELQSIAESDDPLDIYSRYVKWTLGAYPSAESTPQSQLLPLLERATKAFLQSSDYKNDPRYLKLWLHYIRLFSDTPRETFAFLARHSIGEHLALFYEEFAAWLETNERWNQADEVYQLGIEREARPAERLVRKYTLFQQRYEARSTKANEPSSPALPRVRAALAAKIDPFAPATTEESQQESRPATSNASKPKKAKMAIFSDAEAQAPPAAAPVTNGWDSIGSIRDRKKENTMEPQPWAGQTLKGGKKVGTASKMEVFKDPNESRRSKSSRQPEAVVNPRTGRAERVFVNMDEVYTNDGQEFSFEELRALRRGWTGMDWKATNHILADNANAKTSFKTEDAEDQENLSNHLEQKLHLDEQAPNNQQEKCNKARKHKHREVKQETQTVKLRDSPTSKPRPRRKVQAEPTMTFNSKAAHNDIYEMYNNASKDTHKDDTHSGVDTDFDDDTFSMTGKFSTTNSDFGDETVESVRSFGVDENTTSPWSDFTTGKVSKILKKARSSKHKTSRNEDHTASMSLTHSQSEFDTQAIAALAGQDFGELDTIAIARIAGNANEAADVEATEEDDELKTPVEVPVEPKYIPLPPEDYQPPPMRPYRDADQLQYKMPFMTPIVERTESSLAAATIYQNQFTAPGTPRQSIDLTNESPSKLKVDSLLLDSPRSTTGKRKNSLDIEDHSPKRVVTQSPAHENQRILFPAAKLKSPERPTAADDDVFKTTAIKSVKKSDRPIHKGPIIQDLQCNPCDESVIQQILKTVHPAPSTYPGFHDYEQQALGQFNQVKAYVRKQGKAAARSSPKKPLSDSMRGMAPLLQFAGSDRVYAVKRELGEGAFAPVFLVESAQREESSNDQLVLTRGNTEAIKAENEPRTLAWEFHVLSLLQARLGRSDRAMQSIVRAHECHLYRDECYLVLEYHSQGTLLDLVNLCRAENIRAGKTAEGLEEPVAMWLAAELLRTVEAMHKVGILHGDLKADNCLVRFDPETELTAPYNQYGHDGWQEKGLTLIDLGRGIDTKAFKAEAMFIADWKASETDCPEIREAKPWKWEIDMFGAAGVIHSLLFGKYIETVSISGGGLGQRKEWKLRENFKRYWEKDIWTEVFQVLMNCGGKKDEEVRDDLKRVRVLMETWLEEESERNGRDLRGSIRRCERLLGTTSAPKSKR